MTTAFKLRNSLLVLALTGIYPVVASAATSAGVVQFIAGDVNVRRTDGQSTPLVKGNDLESGQAIVTGATGRAQVRFSDGGLVSLQPNTEFKIASYVDKADPQQDRFLVDLLRGSMRAITGLIGKRNKNNYRVTTTTATIGIRGSGFTAGYNPDGSLNVAAEKDAIEVCSGGVCVGLVAGESATVRSSNEAPVRTRNRASIPTPPLAQEVETIGNQTNADGSSSLIAIPGSAPAAFVDRTFNDIKVVAVTTYVVPTYSELISSQGPTATSFRNNKLLKLTDESPNTKVWAESGIPQPITNFNSIGNVTDPDFVGWGMWTNGTKLYQQTTKQFNNFHYVAGRPTTASDLLTFVNLGSNIYNYTLIGSTAPTRNGVAGNLFSASFTVTTQQNSAYGFILDIYTSFGNHNMFRTGNTTSSFSDVSGEVTGSFFGSGASKAGMTYGFDNGAGIVKGALVFQK